MLKIWNRIGATVIDMSIIAILVSLSGFILVFFFPNILAIRGGGEPIELVYDFLRVLFFLMLAVLVAVSYNVLMHKRYKKTFGQMFMRVNLLEENSSDKKVIYIDNAKLLKREMYKWTLIVGTFNLYSFFCLAKLFQKQELYHNKKAKVKVEVWV